MAKHLFNMKINEVSFCRKGMNVGARVSLFKMNKTLTFNERLEVVNALNEKFEASNDLHTLQEVLGETVVSIAFDEILDSSEKRSKIIEAFNQFRSNADELFDPLSKGEKKMNLAELLKALGDASPEVKKEIEDMFAKAGLADESTKELEKLKAVVEDLKKSIPTKPDEDEDDKIAKAKAAGASDEVLDLLKSMREDQKADREKLEKREQETLKKSFIEKAEHLKPAGNSETVATMFEAIHKGCGNAGVELVQTVLARLCKAVEEGDLLKEKGGSGNNTALEKSDEIMAKVLVLAGEVMKANPKMTKEQAQADIWKKHPDLYEAYTKSKTREIAQSAVA